jgi:hypothetical protein
MRCREEKFLRLNIKRSVPYESVRFAVGRIALAQILDPMLTAWFGFHPSNCQCQPSRRWTTREVRRH